MRLRGESREWLFRLAGRAGLFRMNSVVRPVDATRLVFVCKGNICRSPFAEAYARQLGLNSVSFGLSAISGRTAHPDSIEAAQRFGIELEAHRTRNIVDAEISTTDLVLAMEPVQIGEIRRRLGEPSRPVALLGMTADQKVPYIFDPYGRGPEDFDRCFIRIINSLQLLTRFCPEARLTPDHSQRVALD